MLIGGGAVGWGLVGPAALGGVWAGIGVVSWVAHSVRRWVGGAAALWLPMVLRMVSIPLVVAAVAFRAAPPPLPFAAATLSAVGLFLFVEVALTLRNLRRRI